MQQVFHDDSYLLLLELLHVVVVVVQTDIRIKTEMPLEYLPHGIDKSSSSTSCAINNPNVCFIFRCMFIFILFYVIFKQKFISNVLNFHFHVTQNDFFNNNFRSYSTFVGSNFYYSLIRSIYYPFLFIFYVLFVSDSLLLFRTTYDWYVSLSLG